MVEEEVTPRPIYIPPDLLEEIFLGLPLKSIIKFKTVSNQWRSILESKRFAERRMDVQRKGMKILAGRSETLPWEFEGEEEVELFCLQGPDATRPSLTCDGLVCIPVPGCVNILNPSTGQLLCFPSGADPMNSYDGPFFEDPWWNAFPGYWSVGFGRDKVNGNYKVVRMFFDTNKFDILDVNTGEWQKLSPPPYSVNPRRKSACVNGSIYWLEVCPHTILALDLHTKEFRDVPILPYIDYWTFAPGEIVNLDDRLTITTAYATTDHWNIDIWSMDAQEETWTKTYSIPLFERVMMRLQVRPLAVSKQGNLVFHDSDNRLFQYYPETDSLRCLASCICVISPFVENLFQLPHPKIMRRASFHRSPIFSQIYYLLGRLSRQIERVPFPNTLLITGLVLLLIFR